MLVFEVTAHSIRSPIITCVHGMLETFFLFLVYKHEEDNMSVGQLCPWSGFIEFIHFSVQGFSRLLLSSILLFFSSDKY